MTKAELQDNKGKTQKILSETFDLHYLWLSVKKLTAVYFKFKIMSPPTPCLICLVKSFLLSVLITWLPTCAEKVPDLIATLPFDQAEQQAGPVFFTWTSSMFTVWFASYNSDPNFLAQAPLRTNHFQKSVHTVCSGETRARLMCLSRVQRTLTVSCQAQFYIFWINIKATHTMFETNIFM